MATATTACASTAFAGQTVLKQVSELSNKVGNSEARVQMRGSKAKASSSIWSVMVLSKIESFFLLSSFLSLFFLRFFFFLSMVLSFDFLWVLCCLMDFQFSLSLWMQVWA
jgi:hypothetical protein